jgi:hypothetical protein
MDGQVYLSVLTNRAWLWPPSPVAGDAAEILILRHYETFQQLTWPVCTLAGVQTMLIAPYSTILCVRSVC